MSDLSNVFQLTITAQTVLGAAAAATAPGTWSPPLAVTGLNTLEPRLDPFNPNARDYADCAGGTEANTYSLSRAFIWASRMVWDPVMHRALMIHSPHPFDEFGPPGPGNPTSPGNMNSYITVLSGLDEDSSSQLTYEAPLNNKATRPAPGNPAPGDWPRCVAHGFDNNCIAGRVLYKATLPVFLDDPTMNPPSLRNVQPQIVKINLDLLTTNVVSGREGAAYMGQFPVPIVPLTAGCLDYLPGCNSLCHLHKSIVYFMPLTTEGVWTTVNLGFSPEPNAIHNVGHYHPILGEFVGGGGALAPDTRCLEFVAIHGTTKAIRHLDDSPVVMSVSETNLDTSVPVALRETKCCFTWDPNSTESIAFHDNLNIYAINPNRPAGQQWRVIGTIPVQVGEVDAVCSVADYGGILTFHSRAAGGAHYRFYRPGPVPAADTTAPSIPLLPPSAAVATGPTAITFSWLAAVNDAGANQIVTAFGGYEISLNGGAAIDVGNVLTTNRTGLVANTVYNCRVRSYDLAGNRCAYSATSSVTTPPVSAGQTINAANATQAEVQARINQAQDGDTVLVPAGSGTWSTLSCSKAITIRGAGVGATNITFTGTCNLTKSAAGRMRILGFRMSKTGGGPNSLAIRLGGSWLSAEPIVFEECEFISRDSGFFEANTLGVIWAKSTWDCDSGGSILKGNFDERVPPGGQANAGSSLSWKTNDSMGMNDTLGKRNLYVEDCYMIGGAAQAFDFDNGSRIVFRNNRCDLASFNSHGLDTSGIGHRHFEVYGNDFRYQRSGQALDTDLANLNWLIWIRGGTGVIFNNILDDIAGSFWGQKSEGKFDIRTQQDGSGQQYGDFQDGRAWLSTGQGTYPRQHQLSVNWSSGVPTNGGYYIDPIYIWGNTGAGANGTGGLLGFSNGGSWGSQTGYFNSGRDYFNGGTAKPGYTPYTYPHPLRITTGQAFAGAPAGPPPLPEGNTGIAASFPNDVGIAGDSRVIFADTFESYTATSQLTSSGNYSNFFQGGNFAIDTAQFFSGTKSLRMRMPSTGSEVSNALVKVLSPTRDALFMRVYTRFQPTYAGVNSAHNGLRVTGNYGGPGIRPNGTDFFLVNVDNSKGSEAEPGYTHAYVYHPEQDDVFGEHWFSNGTTANGSQSFGPFFVSRPNIIPVRGSWICYEMHLQLNTPGLRDGRVAVWQNGVLIADWLNLRFRDVSTLKINEIQLENGGQGSSQVNDKWYDNLVIATSYIGPVV